MASSVAVLDIGKTNIKVLAFDEQGNVVAQASRANAALPANSVCPYLHLDAEGAWAFLIEGLTEIAAAAPIDAVSITTHGAAGVLVDDEGAVLPPMDYEWEGCDVDDEAYAAVRPPFDETFSPNLARGLNLGRQLFYFFRHHPAEFAQGARIPDLPPILGLAALRGDGVGDDLAGLPQRPMEAARGGFFQSGRPPGVERPFPALTQGLGEARPCQGGSCGGDRTSSSRASALRRARFQRRARSLPCRTKRPVHGAFDGNLGHHHGSRRQGQARPRRRHAGERRCEGRAGAHRSLHGRTRVCHPRRRRAGAGQRKPTSPAIVARGALALPSFSDQGGPFAGRMGRILGPQPTTAAGRTALATLYAALVTANVLERLQAPGELIIEGGFAQTPRLRERACRIDAGSARRRGDVGVGRRRRGCAACALGRRPAVAEDPACRRHGRSPGWTNIASAGPRWWERDRAGSASLIVTSLIDRSRRCSRRGVFNLRLCIRGVSNQALKGLPN